MRTAAERKKINSAVTVMMEICGAPIPSANAMEYIVRGLDAYPMPAIEKAIDRCRMELKGVRNPLAEIVERIDDGRPGPEQAWAMVPKDEWQSAVWTDEMRQAYGAAYDALRHDDRVTARMAFLEAYKGLVAEAKRRRLPVRWSLTLGTDKGHREGIVRQALQQGHIGKGEAARLIAGCELAGSAEIKAILQRLNFEPKLLEGEVNGH